MRFGGSIVALLFVAAVGCSSGSGQGSDVAPDTTAPDASLEDVPVVPADVAIADDATSDTPDIAGDSGLDAASGDPGNDDVPADVPVDVPVNDPADIPTAGPYPAQPGARCDAAARIGMISLGSYGWEPYDLSVSVVLNDRPVPVLPEVALKDASCAYLPVPAAGSCDPCPQGTQCGPDGTCRTLPVPIDGAVVAFAAGGQTQEFATQGGQGAWGSVELPGGTYAVSMTWGDTVVTLAATAMPAPLDGLKGTMAGGYDKPTALDLIWTPPLDPARVFTSIPINHHAGNGTTTECDVDAAAGALHVDGAMLEPLAVVTGLEFQGVQHIRFAAAQTPAGCVEFRFFTFQMIDQWN